MQASNLLPAALLNGKPRRIAWLMDLYERNYQLLQRLLGQLDLPFEHAVSKSATDLPLHLMVIERAPYTVELRLTYEFRDAEGIKFSPDFWIKLYNDAKVAEALHMTGRPPWLAQEGDIGEAQAYLNDQWSRNVMLHKWLEYLLHHGHGFTHVARPRKADIA